MVLPNPATAFISYARESDEHIDQVVDLANRLRLDGIDCQVDEYEEAPPEGWQLWMERQIKTAQYVLLICTPQYRAYFEGEGVAGRGLGVTWERSMITAALYSRANHNEEFIPVLLTSANRQDIPTILTGATYYDLSLADGYERLLRRLTGQRRRTKPPVGPVKVLPPKGRKKPDPKTPFSDQERNTVLDIIAERVQFLAPGILPRVGERATIEEAIARGVPGDAAIRVMRHLSGAGLFSPLGLIGSDELVVDLKRLEALRDTPRPIPDEVTGPEAPQEQPPLSPSFQSRFRTDDQASEPNYYTEVTLRNTGAIKAGPARLMCLCYAPRNAWDSRGGIWPINILPNLGGAAPLTILGHDNYGNWLDRQAVKTFPGFHLAGGFQVQVDPSTTLYSNDNLLLATVEIFGPDLIIDWRLDVPDGTYYGTERCSRPVDSSLTQRFGIRSRLRMAVRNSRLVSTPDGDRIICDVVMPDYGFRVESSCWAELVSQWGSDLTARTLIKEALSPAAAAVQVRLAEADAAAKPALQRLQYQLALETPIRLDDYYARVLGHYKRLGDTAHVSSVTDEWARAIAKSVSQVPIPSVDGEIT